MEDHHLLPQRRRHRLLLPQDHHELAPTLESEFFELADEIGVVSPEPREVLEQEDQWSRLGNGVIQSSHRVLRGGYDAPLAAEAVGAGPDEGGSRTLHPG